MPNLFEQISSILTQPYGSMAYHLVISFIFIGVLYPTLVFSSEEQRYRRRMLIGVSGLLAAQLLIFIVSALVLVGFSGLSQVLPVLDRMVTLLNVVISTWLFAYTRSTNRRVDIAIVALIGFIFLAGVFTMFSWTGSAQSGGFMKSPAAQSWNIGAALLTILGQVLIFRSGSRTRAWGIAMLLVITCGEVANITFATSGGDYSVILRLTYLISFPLLYGVTGSLQSQVTHTKMIVTSIPDSPQIPSAEPHQAPQEAAPIEPAFSEPVRGIDLHLFQNTMALAGSTNPQEACLLYTRYVAHALVSDICLLLSPPDEQGNVHLISAYDLIVQESFSPFTFEHSLIPGYLEALQSGESIQVSDDTSSQISTFAHLVLVERIYSMLIYPLVGSQGQSLAAICLISPYSKYVWTEKEYKFLRESSSVMATAIERALYPGETSHSPALDSLTEQLSQSENERSRLEAEMVALSAELAALSMIADEQPGETGDQKVSGEQMATLTATLEVLENENETLKQQISAMEDRINEQVQTIGQLEESTAASPAELEDLSAKLQEALKRAGNFEQQLNHAKTQLEFYDQQESSPTRPSTLPTEQAEVIASIAQELRQPMSSISGYTDLLISESVGILGALQKKFLERVKASTDRMNHLIGDLIQITTLDSGNLAFTPQPVEVIEIVDLAIETTSGQFREKDIALRVDISPHLPKMHTDKDALQQILLHLLQNAGAATPEEGEIHVKIEPYNKTESDIILIAVTDSGEGIPREDLPRVFSRLYRADNPLIPGVGDTGVGLSIAKTLAEALGGRIWVESDQGVGSTFSVLLPITTQTVDAVEG